MYRFKTTWGWVNYDAIIFGWTVLGEKCSTKSTTIILVVSSTVTQKHQITAILFNGNLWWRSRVVLLSGCSAPAVTQQEEHTARTLLPLLEIHNKYTATGMHGADVLASHIVAQWGRWEGVQRKWELWLTVWGLWLVSTALSANNYNSSVLHAWSLTLSHRLSHRRKTRWMWWDTTSSYLPDLHRIRKCVLILKLSRPLTSALTRCLVEYWIRRWHQVIARFATQQNFKWWHFGKLWQQLKCVKVCTGNRKQDFRKQQ